jgi:hypothetical protein
MIIDRIHVWNNKTGEVLAIENRVLSVYCYDDLWTENLKVIWAQKKKKINAHVLLLLSSDELGQMLCQ